MAKTLRTAALVIGAVALVATGVGALAGAGAFGAAAAAAGGTVAGISTATIAAVGTYASLAAGVLSIGAAAAAPGVSVQGSASTFQTNPQSGLPYAMGRTRMSGLRMFAATNSRPGYTKFNDLLWFGALLSIGGAIDSIESFAADGVAVTFAADGNAIGTYHDYMGQKLHLGGPQASAIDLVLGGGSAPGWTSDHKLSGITHAMWCLRFNKEGDMYGAGAPEPAWVGKWVKVYDPRLDSTYPGGAGPCRALDESTYVWSQNPALHGLTWALGRWENGKRTCGIGAPIANIRVAEFVECANINDANGWKVGGVEWTTDTKWNTLKRILQAGGARPTKSRGMIGCLVSAPRTAIATIEHYHLIDKLHLNVTKSRRDRFNTVIPRYVDEASDWAVISGTAISVPGFVTADRGGRTKEIDYPLVQVFTGEQATQPGQLAAYDIVNSREGGPFTWSTGPEWIGIKTGDVIHLNVPEEGLVNQPMLITKATPDPATGKINFAGETETHSKHAFALGQSTTPPSPFSMVAPDLKPPAPETANWAVTGTTTGEGLPAIIVLGASEHPSADALVIDYRQTETEDWTRSAILSAIGPVMHLISPLASATSYEIRIGYRAGTIEGNYSVLAPAVTGVGKLSGIEPGATNGMNDADAQTVAAQFQSLSQSILGETILAGNWRSETDSAIHDGTGALLRTVVEEIGARSADHEAFIKFIRSVDAQNGNATFGMISIVDGAVGGFLGLNDGEIVDLSFLIDIFRVIDRNGGDPIQVIEYDNGVLELNAEVRAKTLKVGAMDYEFTLNQTITATQGSQTLPGGVVMKWGQYRAAISDEVQLSIVFDEPFPTVCQSFVPVPYITTFSPFRDLWLQNVGAPTPLGASVGTQSSTSNNQQLDGFDWIAFGK